MSHYAKVVNGIVIEVLVAEEAFIASMPGTYIQTSYNTYGGVHYDANTNLPDNGVALRGNYAGLGYIYDSIHDVFYPPKPYPSWTIAAPNWTWVAPVTYPTDGQFYIWDETTKTWVKEIQNQK